MPDLFDSLAPAINASCQWGPALFPPVVQTILPGGATSLREAMAMNAVLRQADGGNGLLSAQYVMPGPLTSYSNIPIQATVPRTMVQIESRLAELGLTLATRCPPPLTHAHRALHFECRGAPVVRRGDARVAWPLPYHLVCVERFTLPYLTCT